MPPTLKRWYSISVHVLQEASHSKQHSFQTPSLYIRKQIIVNRVNNWMFCTLSASKCPMTTSSFHHHQHAYFSIITTIFWNFCGSSDFLENLCGSGFWNFFHLLRIFKEFIHVAPLDLVRGGYTGG